jgi:hypothetical protein
MWTNNCRLLLFTRYPEAGNTKTRLIPELGAGGAALLQKRLTERVVMQANLLTERLGIETIVHYAGGNSKKMASWLGPMHYVEQTSGDLGQRMRAAFEHSFAGGAETAVLVGSDIPEITAGLLQQAFTSLMTREVVIGPTWDGGYYLIGLVARQAPQLLPLIFDKMSWSTGDVLTNTTRRLERAGYDAATLPALRDIDLPEDLPFAREQGLL